MPQRLGLLLLAVALLTGCGTPALPTPPPRPAATVTATHAPRPPSPAARDVAATALAQVDATLAALPTSEPTRSPAELAFARHVVDQAGRLSEVLDSVAALLAAPRPGDSNWRFGLGLHALTVEGMAREMDEHRAPASLRAAHRRATIAFGVCRDALRDLSRAANEGSAWLLDRAVEATADCAGQVVDVVEEAQDMLP